MKATIFSILTVFICFTSVNAQIVIECPADVTVYVFDLDSDFDTYGDPNVSTPDTYNLNKEITVIDNNCNGQSITLKYTATENNTGNTAFCVQTISVTIASLTDIQWPAETVVLATGSKADLNPGVMTERPEPFEILIGGSSTSTIIISYEDVEITGGPQVPYKVVRTWTALDWCSAETSTFIQVLKIDVLDGTGSGVLEVQTENGATTFVQDIIVTTDQVGFTLDFSNCDLSNNDLQSYLNCVADNNAIDPTSKLIVEFDGQNDPLNGVSTLDMVLIQRHILGINPLTSDCKIRAADLTNDGRVTAVDLLTMRKLILGVIVSLPSSPSWVYLIDYDSSGLTLINENETTNIFNITKSEFPIQNLTLKAIKIGDVNDSVIGPGLN